jgi:hypothetical protein
MREPVKQAISQLEAKLEGCLNDPSRLKELDQVQQVDLAKLPRWLTAAYEGESPPMPRELVCCIELHEELLRRLDLLPELAVVVRTMLFERPYETSPSLWWLPEDPWFFQAAFESDLFHEATFEWLRANLASSNWQACLTYCGIVKNALMLFPVGETNTWGELRKERAQSLYTILLERETCLARWKTAMEAMVSEGFPERAVSFVADWEFQEELFVRARERVWRTSESEWNPEIHAKNVAETKRLLDEVMPRLQAMCDCEKRRGEQQRAAGDAGQVLVKPEPPDG